MARDGALAIEVVTQADPIFPKIDLVLGDEGLEWAEEPVPTGTPEEASPQWNELVQSVLMGILMQRGDWRYDRRRGMPWTQHDRMKAHTAIMGSNFNPSTLRGIEAVTMAELPRADERVASVLNVTATVSGATAFAQRRLQLKAQFYTVTGELVGVQTEVPL